MPGHLPGRGAAAVYNQPPEQRPPERPPGEETPPDQGAQPPAEAPESGETSPAGEEESSGEETPAEAPEGEEGTGDESGADPETGASRAPEMAAAPVGILPGRVLAAPAPAPGSPVIGLILGEDGLVLHSAGGRVVAYEPDGQAARWGLPNVRAVFVAEEAGTLVILDERGDVTLRAAVDGQWVSGFSTGFAPDPGVAAGEEPPRAPATLAAGTLYWISEGSLRGYRVTTGNAVLEVSLPSGEPASVVSATPPAAAPEKVGEVPPLLLVSLGSAGVAAVSASAGTTSGALRWHAESAAPVTGPVLPLWDDGLAIIGDEGGDLTAVDLETGARRWRWRLAEGFHFPPLASRGRLYAATKANSLYCFDARRGGERWRAALPGRPAAPPIRMAGAILVVTRDGLLVEVNAETGERIGTPRDLDGEVLGVVGRMRDSAREDGWRDRRLFLGLRDGRLLVLAPGSERGQS